MPGGPSACDPGLLAVTAARWLIAGGLDGCDVPTLLAGLCRELDAGGLAIARAGCSFLTLHPQIISAEVVWRAGQAQASTVHFTPAMMEDPANRRGPYFRLALTGRRWERFRLAEPEGAVGIPLLEQLAGEGCTDYLAFHHPTGGAAAVSPYARRLGLAPCIVGSFATARPGGFSDDEAKCLLDLWQPLALAVKARANHETAARLLDLYVGRASGAKVLEGRIARGDGERISCGIFLADLRGSSRLAAGLELEDYIALLDRYFDAAAGAVIGHGGEVLKLIGDAVLGIFRTDRPADDVAMRERALAAADATLAGLLGLAALGRPLEVGIALHAGEVMYGNVGTNERLDFTVIGPAVNEAARLQDLTRRLARPVLASASFAAPLRGRFDPLGPHPVPGLDHPLEVFAPHA